MKYRKKPVVIEAFQMTRERRLDNSEWPAWLHQAWQKPVTDVGSLFYSPDGCLDTETYTPLFIQTLAGSHRVSWDDWIIHEEGELYVCEPKAFEAGYEAVDDSPWTPTGLLGLGVG